MPDLTKTRTVLQHTGNVGRGPVFEAADDEGRRLTQVILDRDVWEEFGDPDKITVTIEPGDLLNGDAEEDTRTGPAGPDVSSLAVDESLDEVCPSCGRPVDQHVTNRVSEVSDAD